MRIPFLDLKAQYQEIHSEIDAVVLEALRSGWYILGRKCEEFETAFKEYLVGNSEGYVIGVNSGTDAIKLSLLASGVGPGDEVITVANTAIPTAAAICSVRAIPIFCDVDPKTWLMDSSRIEGCITKKTKAVIPVHLYGASCDMEAIIAIAKKYGLAVIEDTAQAAGAEFRGYKCGTIGDFGAFSFYPSKNLGACGDGGAVFVKSTQKRELLSKLRNYGQSSRYQAEIQHGENTRLDEIQAAILSVKLNHLGRWNMKREELHDYYISKVMAAGMDISTQQEYSGTKSAFHLFVIKVAQERRDYLIERLSEKGVQSLVHYPYPIYEQDAFAMYKKMANPVSEDLCSSVLSLPFHQYLSFTEIDYVVQCVTESLD